MAIDYGAAETAYYDNADYDVTGSVTRANAFVTACRQLIGRARKTGHGAANVEFDPASLQEQLETALSWLASNDTTNVSNPGVRHMSLRNFRT